MMKLAFDDLVIILTEIQENIQVIAGHLGIPIMTSSNVGIVAEKPITLPVPDRPKGWATCGHCGESWSASESDIQNRLANSTSGKIFCTVKCFNLFKKAERAP